MTGDYEATQSPRQNSDATRGGSYQLKVRVDHMRRHSMSTLLFSLAQQALISERRGESFEQVHCHLTGDGDYSALAVVYPASGLALSETNGTDVAEDDITAADEVVNGEQREADETARLQRIEEFKRQDAERWRK